ncbi:uncharacterized protein LOC117341909 [Pecten maximus]|uniref:uncharacterized protein LOC117341909 n=1 Tax=Pecten maximus TaxID=6579 RepID=UPI001457EFCD|nr:uncharacterized protein LOC117341909 [Pecten maximus]
MVERFNKTLVTMLSAFVNNHQTDWDEHLPYVMMAYRSTEHETTGNSPNAMMLGRETSTPLDIQYEMPRNIKTIPQNQWAWQLKEKMENAHELVRKHSKGAMIRQKRYHDQKLSWTKFEPGDSVYVFFPNIPAGTTHKLASRWRGPFKILTRLTEVTYRVPCGYKGKTQVIHADRMRPRPPQVLRGESRAEAFGRKDVQVQVDETCFEQSQNESVEKTEKDLVLEELGEKLGENECEPNGANPRRTRRKPQWHSDYTSFY